MNPTNQEPDVPDIPGFIRSCVESAGGAVEAGPPGRLDVLLPPQLEAAAGGRSWVRLALANDNLEHDAEPATLGSPFMDALIAFASGRGTVASGHLPAGRLKKRGLREEVERTLRFSNCRTRHEYAEADVLLAATAQFDFKVVFLSEERRERLFVVPVNLFSNQVQPLLAERLSGFAITTEPVARFPEAPQVPIGTALETATPASPRTISSNFGRSSPKRLITLSITPSAYSASGSPCQSPIGTALETARRALARSVVVEAARYQVRVARRFAVDFARISDYYAQAIADLRRRRVREMGRASRAPASREPNTAPEAGGATPTTVPG